MWIVIVPAIAVIPMTGFEPGGQVALKLAALSVTATVLVRRRLHCRLDVLERWLAAFATAAVASTIVSGSGLAAGASSLVAAACLVMTARATRGMPWRSLETAATVAASLVAAGAFLELLGVRWPWTFVRRPESTLGNRNEVAMYLVIALPIVVGAALRGYRSALPAVSLMIAVIVATRCRSAYVAGTAGLVCAIVYGERARLRRVGLATLLGLACGALPWPGVQFRPSVADAASRVLALDGSGRVRVHQHELALAALDSEPRAWLIGFGAGTWERIASQTAHAAGDRAPRFTGATVPNSELVRIVTEQGLVGLGLLAGACLALVRSLARSPERCVGIGAVVAAGVCGVFDPVLVRPELVALLGAIAGSAADPSARESRPWLAPVCALASCVALARFASFAAEHARRPELANALWSRPTIDEQIALRDAAHGDCDGADHALTTFLAARPHHWGARVAVARCFERNNRTGDAVRVWRSAFAMEPHLRELLLEPKERP